MKTVLLSLILMTTIACTGKIPTTPPQTWGDYTFRLETRPPAPIKGMNEFLLIGNFEKRKRAVDLLVFFRVGPTGKWSQAIQDGHSGVYRRALRVNDVAQDVLYVHVKKEEEEKVFEFPLNYAELGEFVPLGQ